jgi:serine phosphatase RsbU (regulator of sigma subunit)/PAS domain-containing protein
MALQLRRIVPALGLTLAIVAADTTLGESIILVPLLVLGPLLAAATTGPRGAAAIGSVAVAASLALGAENDLFGSARHLVAVSTVLVGAVLSTIVARSRDREHAARLATERGRLRADLLARAGELFETGTDPLGRLDAVSALPVPELADLCVIDLVGPDGVLRSAAVTSTVANAADEVRAMRYAHPVPPGSDHPVARVARTGDSLLLRRIRPDDRAIWATSPEHLELIRRLDYRSAVVVPLSARGRTVGTLAMIRLGRGLPFDDGDLRAAEDLARRAGLAIDHARLGTELGETESELHIVLEALTEAVTVQDRSGRIVYANAAAARLNGSPTVRAMLDTPIGDVMAEWDVRDEHGAPIPLERFPGRQALAGVEPAPLLMQLTHRETGEHRWRIAKATPVPGSDGAPRLAVNVVEDVTEQRRREFSMAFLARASKLLTASLDPAETLEKVAWAAVPELADWCAVDMPDERGRLRRVATADRSPERTRITSLVVRERSGDRTLPVGPPEVMRTGTSQFYPEITDDVLRAAARDMHQLEQLRAVGARSVLVVPMVAAAGVIGTITLGSIESGRRLTHEDLLLAEELGRRAGIAVEHSRVHGERSEVAATLQAALLPPRLPVVPELTLAARFRAAGGGNSVGGDFYDLFPLEGEPAAWMVVMGDVTGKGPAAAAITSLARYAMRTAALYERDPSRVLQRLNHVLVNDDHPRRLCTAVCARVEAAPGRATVTVACAGHPPPLLTNGEGRVDAVGRPGTLLGAFEDGHWSDTTVELGPRDTLLLYTDGVTDTRGPDGRFGVERLEQVVAEAAGRDPDHLASVLDDALLRFQDGAQRDDVAVLALQPGPSPGDSVLVGEGGAYAPTRSSDAGG